MFPGVTQVHKRLALSGLSHTIKCENLFIFTIQGTRMWSYAMRGVVPVLFIAHFVDITVTRQVSASYRALRIPLNVVQCTQLTFVLNFNVLFASLYGIYAYICRNTYTYENNY
jgi:hypothetical protein